MGERSAIAWTRSTFNPWIGCTKVGPGCDNCYAENLDSRKRWGGITHWGPGVARHRTSASNWKQPLAWNRKAAETGEPWRVFCSSLADVFDNEAPMVWRHDLWKLILDTPHLTWLLLTKRIGNVSAMWPVMLESPPPNVWLGATVVNQEEANRDIPKLLAVPASTRFVSYEPAVAPINFARWLDIAWSPTLHRWKPLNGLGVRRPLDWIIVGGESGSHARPFRVEWARRTVQQCRDSGIAVFVKQMGAFVVDRNDAGFDGCEPESWPLRPDGCDPDIEHDIYGYIEEYQGADCRIRLMDRAGADPNEWPEDLRVQEFPAEGREGVSGG